MAQYFLRRNHSNRSLFYWVRLIPLAMAIRLIVTLYRYATGHPSRRYSEVLPQLWVGGQQFRRGVNDMRKKGITAVLNLRTRPNDAEMRRLAKNVDYLWLPTTDHTPPSIDDIQRGVDFIQNQIDNGGTVYVHCREGVGRAPTMTACYLVHSGMTPDAAWDTIRSRRPFVYPTAGQVAQVVSYYRSLNPQAGGSDDG